MIKKLILSFALLAAFGVGSHAYAAPYYTFQPTLLPQINNGNDLGTTTQAWRYLYTNNLCLAGDCRSVWPGGASLGAGTVNSSANGTFYSTATSSLTLGTEFSNSGILGSMIGGTNGTLTLATNGVALTKLAQIAGNSILGNNTGSVGNVVAFATSSLNIALSDTTGTLSVGRGGTGQTTFTVGQLLYGNGAAALSSVGTTTPTLGLGLSGTLTTINSTAQSLSIATSSLYTGTVGQIPYFSGTNTLQGTSTISISTGSLVGIGTTSPYAALSLSPNASSTPMFSAIVAGSSTPAFVIDSATRNGNVGLATSSPFARLSVAVTTILSEWMFRVGNVFGITSGGAVKLSEDRPATTTAITLDWRNEPPLVTLNMGTSNYTVTFINATTSDWSGSRKMIMTCAPGAGTPGTPTFTNVEWAGGTAPTFTTTVNQCDVTSVFIGAATSTAAAPTYKMFGAASTGFQ